MRRRERGPWRGRSSWRTPGRCARVVVAKYYRPAAGQAQGAIWAGKMLPQGAVRARNRRRRPRVAQPCEIGRTDNAGDFVMIRKIAMLAAAGLFAASTGLALAQSTTQNRTPGHEMQNKGSVKGHPGASG